MSPGSAAIAGAGGTSYVPTAADVGTYLAAQVAGTNASGYALAGARTTAEVQARGPALRAETVPP
jgi:hypothetical protein